MERASWNGAAASRDGAGGCAAAPPGRSPAPSGAPPARSWRALDADNWHNHFLQLLDRVPMPIAVCEVDGQVLLANPAMAGEWGWVPGQMKGRHLLDLLQPRSREQMERLTNALRLGHRSRYPVAVRWRTDSHAPWAEGELTVDPVDDPTQRTPLLLALLRPLRTARPPAPAKRVGEVEARILALAAAGATTEAIGREVGLTVDGVNYHLARLARRWRVRGRTALVARAYTLGVLSADHWPPRPA